MDGYCGVFACRRKDTVYICAITGAPNSKTRFEICTKLIEEAFANYTEYELASIDEPVVEDYPVESGDTGTVDLYTKESISILLKKSDGEPTAKFNLPDVLSAPLNTEFSVGSVSFIDRNGSLLYEAALYPERNVYATGFTNILKRVLFVYINR